MLTSSNLQVNAKWTKSFFKRETWRYKNKCHALCHRICVSLQIWSHYAEGLHSFTLCTLLWLNRDGMSYVCIEHILVNLAHISLTFTCVSPDVTSAALVPPTSMMMGFGDTTGHLVQAQHEQEEQHLGQGHDGARLSHPRLLGQTLFLRAVLSHSLPSSDWRLLLSGAPKERAKKEEDRERPFSSMLSLYTIFSRFIP